MNKLKVALLGTGFIANIHLESYARFVPTVEIVAIYGRHGENARRMAEQHHIPAWYDDIEKLLNEQEVDMVDICLPNYLHHDACMKAARHNKHIVIEKPLSMTLEEADEMIAKCKKRNLKLMYAEES